MPSEHAELGLGGSTANRTLNCPGWRHEAAKLPPELLNQTSPAAEEGTRLHVETEAHLRDGKPVTSEKVHRALELFEELLEDLDLNGVDRDEALLIEQRVELEGIPGAWGTVDVVIDAGILTILDWKFGDGVLVTAENNDQLQFYGAAALDTVFEPNTFDEDDIVRLAIIQPHGRTGEPELTTWDTTVGALRDWKADFKDALDETGFEIGPWCRFCPAAITCPEIRSKARQIVSGLGELQPDAIGEWLTICRDALEPFIKSMESLALRQMEAGIDIPGWKLVLKRPVSRWGDEDETLAWCKTKRIPINECAPRTLLSPTQLGVLLKPRNLKVPDELVTRESSGPKIAPVSSKLPRYSPQLEAAAEAFRKQQKGKE